MNNELNFPPNFEGLVLGCIDADFCKYILVGIAICFEKNIKKKGHGKKLKNEFNFPPNFEGLVLGCIDADLCK